jgi:hypothetical protein
MNNIEEIEKNMVHGTLHEQHVAILKLVNNCLFCTILIFYVQTIILVSFISYLLSYGHV